MIRVAFLRQRDCRYISFTLLLVLLMTAVSLLPGAGVARASGLAAATTTGRTINVTTTADRLSPDGFCSLREAVFVANKNVASSSQRGECVAGSGADTIVVPAGDYLLTRSDSGNDDSGSTGDLDIIESVTIAGNGRVNIIGGAGFTDRILHILRGSVVVYGVTLNGGNAVTDGGAILNLGALTLSQATLSGNRTNGRGGGLANRGSASLTNVTISDNRANNSGGGLFNLSGTLDMNNVTVAFNTADADANNTGDGGGIGRSQGTLSVRNSLIGRNTDASPGVRYNDCAGALTSQGYDLIESLAGCTVSGVTTGNQSGTDPKLGPLQDNGGATPTRALLPGSPAIDAANPAAPGSGGAACAATDQRGIPRPAGPRCDMGAFEWQDEVQGGPDFSVIATVGVNDDLNDGVCGYVHCSLREAIAAANARPNGSTPDQIVFNLTNPGGGQPAIHLGSPLPPITQSLIIDGSTQPGGALLIDGSGAGPNADCLSIQGGGSTVRGLTITGCGGSAIVLSGPGGNRIESNALRANGVNGIRILSGEDNALRSNAIHDNGALGIDLGGDGFTPNDTGDPDQGANTLLNAPHLFRAVPGSGVTVSGRYNGAASTAITVEFFSSAACDASGAGEGQTLLGEMVVGTDATGDAIFQPVLSGAPESGFITATARDAAGNTSEFSQCMPVGPANETWPAALNLDLNGDPSSASYEQRIDRQGQSRWFKLAVQPESKLIVTLTNLPKNYDLTVYRDIAAAFKSVGSPQDLERLGAEFAPDAFSPDAYSPDAFSPDAFSPDAYSPDAFSPDAFSPDAYSPDAYSPDAFSPDAYSPDAYSPDAYSPDAYSPDAYSPDAYSPDAYSPDAFSPDAYSSAQARSLVAVSGFGGTASEGVQLNTWLNTGDYFVRVRGRNGAFDAGNPFHLSVRLLTGVCKEVSPIGVPSSTTAVGGGYRTIVLTDLARLQGSDADKAALQARLAGFAARPEVQGVVVDVGADARVVAANAQADLYPSCPYAKNLAAEAIREIVLAYRSENPLEYVVIVGNDDVIPFFRHPDHALLANEKNYVPPVRDNTASQASLRNGYVLSQDDYGTLLNVAVKDDALPLPGLAVGRLVETASDATGMLDAYLTTGAGVVPTPQTALVTGYDFLEDSAVAVKSELEAGMGLPADTLIAPRTLSPQDPAAWTAADLGAKLLGQRHDVVFLAGHFSASSALAADYTTRLRTSDLLLSPVDLTNAIIFSAGCHSGYNVVNAHGVSNVTVEPDWAQAFAAKGATLIAGTGYQYGDTDFIEYSERLYYEFSRQLRTGAGPVAVGKALVAAKQAYLSQVPVLRGIHEKALLETTLFGLPMLSVDLPGQRLTPGSEPSIVGGLSAYPADPGATLGLGYADVTLAPGLTENAVQLKDVQSGAMQTATYLSGPDGVTSGPTEPVLPLVSYNVAVPGAVLRGVAFRGGAYNDLIGVRPLSNAATTEIRGVHSPFLSDIFFPVRLANANHFAALMDVTGGQTSLNVTPAQFRSSSPGSETGILRKYSALEFRLFYSANTTTYGGGSQPALSNAPAIVAVSSTVNGSSVEFQVRVVGDPAAGVQEVWITYTATQGPLAGIWQSLDLVQDPADSSLWKGTLDTAGTAAADVRFIVQAVNGVGLVALDANLGAYHIPGASAQPTEPTSLALAAPPLSGAYGSQATFSALLTSDGSPLAGLPVAFRLGPQSRLAFTDGDGIATATLSLLGIPGENELRASFAGTAQYIVSTATAAFAIQKQNTLLALEPNSAVVGSGEESGIVATLTDSAGRRLGEKTVFFVVTGSGGSYAVAEITDYAGRARLGAAPLPPGDYAITAYFSGTVPLPAESLTLQDDRYEPSAASGSLTIAANASPICSEAQPSPTAVWSPDKSFHAVTVSSVTDPDGDPVTITVTSIFQDERVGKSADGRGIGSDTAEIRANRDGKGNGRVYHIFFTATDGRGGSCEGQVRVAVTHDQGAHIDAIDGGALYDSTVPNR